MGEHRRSRTSSSRPTKDPPGSADVRSVFRKTVVQLRSDLSCGRETTASYFPTALRYLSHEFSLRSSASPHNKACHLLLRIAADPGYAADYTANDSVRNRTTSRHFIRPRLRNHVQCSRLEQWSVLPKNGCHIFRRLEESLPQTKKRYMTSRARCKNHGSSSRELRSLKRMLGKATTSELSRRAGT